jgi:hypothetical protein
MLIFDVQTATAIFSPLNDYLLSNGQPPLGFLNPWLYEAGRVGFYDITSGTNPGCDTDGFSAVVGWDPVRLARPCLFVSTSLIPSPIGHRPGVARLSKATRNSAFTLVPATTGASSTLAADILVSHVYF